MSDTHGGYLELETVPKRRFVHHRFAVRAFLIAAGLAMLLLATGGLAQAQSLRQGVSAFNHQDYVAASRSFIPLAERGVASAQSYLGFMFETGRGIPHRAPV
jgi:hypothetical protein